MKRKFIDKSFNERDAALIAASNRIMDNYASQGYDLSLRQLFYQLVSRNVIPNTNASYELLGRVISDARMAGLVDWDMITDRGRVTKRVQMWSGPGAMIRHASKSYAYNRWKRQPCHIEVMVEKQALEGVICPVCTSLGVNYTSNKGYSSQSALYEASLRLSKAINRGKTPVVLYLGDHDPSGLDMTRDIRARLTIFVGQPVDVKRLSLNKSQVDEYKLPPNPAKMSDSRATNYVSKFGRQSWELDALSPQVLATLVKKAVHRRLDQALWNEDTALETRHREKLLAIAKALENETKTPRKS
jgi:hypothetical protein